MKTTTPETAAASDPKATSETVDAPKETSKEVKTESKEGKSAQKQGTTESLFPGWSRTDSGRSMPPPKKEAVKAEKAQEKPVEKEPEPIAPVPEDIIDPENLKGKKIKLVVDGKEEILPVEDAIKGVQLERNLTSKYQVLDQREKLLNEREKLLRHQLETEKVQSAQQQDDPSKESLFSDDPLIKKMNERLEMVIKENEDLRKTTAKLRFEENIKALSDNIQATYGFDDFMAYKDRVHAAYNALPVDVRPAADTPDWWTNQYLVMKNKDLRTELEKAKSAKPAPPAPTRRDGGIMTGIGDSRGNSVGADENQAWETRYHKAFKEAQETGDWSEVFRLKEEAKSTQ